MRLKMSSGPMEVGEAMADSHQRDNPENMLRKYLDGCDAFADLLEHFKPWLTERAATAPIRNSVGGSAARTSSASCSSSWSGTSVASPGRASRNSGDGFKAA